MKTRAIITIAALVGVFAVFPDCEALESGNIVGFFSSPARQGDNVLAVPPKVGGGLYTLGEMAPSLQEGDRVQYGDEFNQHWAEIHECDDGERHAFSEDGNSLVDEIELPSMWGRQLLFIRRPPGNSDPITLSGEFNEDNPLQPSSYSVESAPLDKLKLDRSLVDSLTVPKTITITNKVQVPFPTVISKQFDIVMKDGRRLRVKVDPKTQLIVDAQSEKPINISSGDIASFEEVGKDADIPQNERASKEEVPKVAADVKAKSKNYNLALTVREAVIGSLWDSEDVSGTFLRWGVVTLVLGFVSKLGDIIWSCIFDWVWRCVCLLFCKLRNMFRRMFSRRRVAVHGKCKLFFQIPP